MSRMTERDRSWGPLTWGPWKKWLSFEWSSGADDDGDEGFNYVRAIGLGWAVRLRLPKILKPFQDRYEQHERTYGFSLTTGGNGDKYGFLQVFYGPQTHDSRTTKSWSKFLPWTQWRHVRTSYYDDKGNIWYSSSERGKGNFRESMDAKEKCPKLHFGFEDYDGEMIVATTCIEEREWHFGEGWFKWLRFFRKPMIRRSLDLWFSEEVGPEKGSWKGGTIGHGIDMLPGETHEAAFRRYCSEERDARRGRKYNIRFIGPWGPPPAKPEPENDCVNAAKAG
jgi:hypothetical protein